MHLGFLRWAELRSDDDLGREVRSNYDLTAHNSVMLRRLLGHARVALWSLIPPAAVRRLGLVPVPSMRSRPPLCEPPISYGTKELARAVVTGRLLPSDGA
jgi:hypothetical protein